MKAVRMWLAGAGAALMTLVGIYLAGRRDGQEEARTRALKADAKAQERMNEADLGIGASDADNMRWLQSFHDKHKR